MERREHRRARLEGRATITTARGDVGCSLVDVSAGGLAVAGDAPAVPGEFVRIRFAVPERRQPHWLSPDAIVVRSSSQHRGHLWGLQFVSLDQTPRTVIDDYVESHRPQTSGVRRQIGTEDVPRPEVDRRQVVEELLHQVPKRDSSAPRPAVSERRSRPEPKIEPATKRELADLYRAALEDVGPRRNRGR